MRISRSLVFSFVLLAFTIAAPVGALGPPDAGINEQSIVSITQNCIQDSSDTNNNNIADDPNPKVAGTITFSGPTKLWPPNHKLTPVGAITTLALDEDNLPSNDPGTSSSNPSGEARNSTSGPTTGDNAIFTVTLSHNQPADLFNGAGKPDAVDYQPPSHTGHSPDQANTNNPKNGSGGATSKDETGVIGWADWQVARERAGQDGSKAGRIYTFNVRAVFTDSDNDDSSENMTTCVSKYNICVPHNMRLSTRTDTCPNPADGSNIQGSGV